MSYYTNDIDTLRQMLSQSFPHLLVSFITVVTVLGVMLYYSFWMTLVVLLGVVMMTRVTKKLGGNSARYFIRQQATLGAVEGYAEEIMASYYQGLNAGGAAVARTMAFATLTAARLFHGFNLRSEHSIFRIGFKRNWYSLGAFALGMTLLALVLFVPGLRILFSVSALSGQLYGMILALAVIPTVIIQIIKVFRDHFRRVD